MSANRTQLDVRAIHNKLAYGFLAAGAGLATIALVGWAIDLPLLSRLGLPMTPSWPQSCIGFALTAVGLYCGMLRWQRAATVALLIPVIIGLLSLVQIFFKIDLGTDLLFFRDSLRALGGPSPGRPGLAPALEFLLLAASVLCRLCGSPRWRDCALLLSLLALIVGILAFALFVAVDFSGNRWSPLFISALPTTIIGTFLSAASTLWNLDTTWFLPFASRSNLARLWWIVPLIVAGPLLAAALDSWIVQAAVLPPAGAKILGTALNLLLMSALGLWAFQRIAGERWAHFEMVQALDSTVLALASPDGVITHWSQGCVRLFGIKPEQAVGANIYTLLHARCSLASAGGGANGGRHPTELCLVAEGPDGNEITVIEQRQRVLSRQGKALFVHAMIDISEHEKDRRRLTNVEERLAIALETHQIGIFEWDVASGTLQWSPGSEQRLGLVPGSISSFEDWRDAVEPEDLDAVMATIEQTIQSRGERLTFAYRFKEMNGRVRAVEGSSRCFYDEQGQLVRTVGVLIDVTERHERELALQAREAQLRSVLDTVPDAMVVIDERGTIRTFSAGAERMFGYHAEQVIGHNVSMLTPDLIRNEHDGYIRRYLETGERRIIGIGRTLTARRSDGTEIPMELRVGEADLGGERVFTGFIRDISDRISAEERVGSLRLELAHALRLSTMGEMASGLAHELNQPLAATANFLAAAQARLERGDPIEDIIDLLSAAGNESLRAGEIIRRLRDFIAKREIDMGAEPVAQMINDAVTLVMVGGTRFEVQIEVDMHSSSALALADRIQVQQVLVNLLRNSIEAMKEQQADRRRIRIASQEVGDFVEISVTDTGPGLPEAILQQLYSPFVSTKGGSGMGIGLSISRRIIEAHGGELKAQNNPGGGATFRFTLESLDHRTIKG